MSAHCTACAPTSGDPETLVLESCHQELPQAGTVGERCSQPHGPIRGRSAVLPRFGCVSPKAPKLEAGPSMAWEVEGPLGAGRGGLGLGHEGRALGGAHAALRVHWLHQWAAMK